MTTVSLPTFLPLYQANSTAKLPTLIDSLNIGAYRYQFFYFDCNRRQPAAVGLSPLGKLLEFKRQGRYEGKHHLHVELAHNNQSLGIFNEDRGQPTSNPMRLAKTFAIYQSLYERLLYDVSQVVKKSQLDEGHLQGAKHQLKQLALLAQELEPSHYSQQIQQALPVIADYYADLVGLVQSHSTASLQQALRVLNILSLPTVNHLPQGIRQAL